MKIPTIKPIPVTYALHIIASSCLMLAISEQILDFHRTGGSIASYVLITTLLMSLVFFTRSLLSSNLRKKRKEAAWSAVWSKIKAENNLAKAISMLLFALTQPIVLLIVYVATTSLASNSARCLAMALASAGNYEASEQLYKFSNRPTQTSLISVWNYPYQRNRGEQLVNIEQKTSAVASVYGSNSLELADYYAFLAEESFLLALRLNEHQEEERALLFEGGLLFSERARQIHGSHKKHSECSTAVSVISIDQMSLDKITAARHSVAKALDRLVKSVPSAEKDLASAEFEFVAKTIGERELAKMIKIAASSRRNPTTQHRRKGFLDATTIAIAMPIFGFSFLLKAWERSILTLIFRKKWAQELKLAVNDMDTLAALDKLTTLELFRGRTQEAQIYSQAMLQTALADA